MEQKYIYNTSVAKKIFKRLLTIGDENLAISELMEEVNKIFSPLNEVNSLCIKPKNGNYVAMFSYESKYRPDFNPKDVILDLDIKYDVGTNLFYANTDGETDALAYVVSILSSKIIDLRSEFGLPERIRLDE